MRVELAVATSGPGPFALAAQEPRRRRIDPFELGLLALFAAVSVWVLALDLWQVVVNGRVWTGTDGLFVIDQMQYVAWIRDASHHLLASNLFVLRATPADYFQPAVAISGALSALGVAPWLALLLWKPVAVAATFYGVRAYANRNLPNTGQRRAALALGLFFGSFTVLYGSIGVIGDLLPGFLAWGYPFGLMSLAAMLFALLAYDRSRRTGTRTWTAPLLGALSASLHPWQGELLMLVILGAELVNPGPAVPIRRRLRLAGWTLAATAVPLVYYAILGTTDESWGLARESSRHSFSVWSILVALAPLALVALLGYRRRPSSFVAAATRAWPIAAVVVYVLSATELSATPLHALEGITIPLAILAVEGVHTTRWHLTPWRRLVAWIVLGAATIPATAFELSVAHEFMAPTAGNANFIARDEKRALDYLAAEQGSGGVLTRFYLGSIVPARTGRRTFVGNCVWSEPRCTPRAQVAQKLFDGTLSPPAARRFVHRTGARFVLTDCQSPSDLRRTLGSLVMAVHRFGCASVYELDAPVPPAGPLAESPGNAAVRATRRQ
jgi:hypothetical protein